MTTTAEVEVWTQEELDACEKRDIVAWAVVQRMIKRGEAVIRQKTVEQAVPA